MSTPLLEVRGVSKRFGGLTANDDVSFTVSEGELVSIIGPNGAGKSTLFNCITGFYRPSAGTGCGSPTAARGRRRPIRPVSSPHTPFGWYTEMRVMSAP